MAQNTSHAVMAQRKEPKNSGLDAFWTPPWATRALCEWLESEKYDLDICEALDPAAGRGHMVRPLQEYFRLAEGSDIHDHGAGYKVEDFLTAPVWKIKPDFIVTNPPFRLTEEFALAALARADIGVALLVRTGFLESAGRYERLFSKHPPSAVLQFVERVPMVKGRIDRNATTATSYCWVFWDKLAYCIEHTALEWIPPCRKRLERDEDYQD